MIFSATDLNEIIPGLYLGSVFAATDLDTLEEHKITHILTMGSYMDPKFPDKFEYKICLLEDDETENIKQYFDEGIFIPIISLFRVLGIEFIQNALDEDGIVFVHCAAGVSRSSSMV